MPSGSGTPAWALGQAQGDLGAENSWQAGRARRLGEAHHTVHAVVVGYRQCPETEARRLFD